MKAKTSNHLWVVVDVRSGIPVFAEVFAGRAKAKQLEQELRSSMRQDYDEIGLFEATVRH